MFPLSGLKRECQCVPRPVTFLLSLPGLDRVSSVLPQGQGPGFFGPTETLGHSGPAGARGVVEEWQKLSGEHQRHRSFHKVTS